MYGKRGSFVIYMMVWTVVFIAVITIVGIYARTQIIQFSEGFEKEIAIELDELKDGIVDEKYNHLALNIISENNLSKEFKESLVIIDENNRIIYNVPISRDIDSVYTNCNIASFKCEIHERNFQLTLENQFNLNKIRKIILTKDQNKNVLILIPILNNEDLINIPIPSTLPKDLEMYKEINQKLKELYAESLKKEFPSIKDDNQIIRLFLDGYYYERLKDYVLFITEFGLQLSPLRADLELAEDEYNSTEKSIQLMILEYNKTIERYYPDVIEINDKIKADEQKKRVEDDGIEHFMSDKYPSNFVDRISLMFSFKSLLVSSIRNLGQRITDLRTTYREKSVSEQYQKKDIQESDASKLLRLKILQDSIVNRILNNCPYFDETICMRALGCGQNENAATCMADFLYDIGDPELCNHPYLGGINEFEDAGSARDQCYFRFSKQDPSLCLEIKNNALQFQCENELFPPLS